MASTVLLVNRTTGQPTGLPMPDLPFSAYRHTLSFPIKQLQKKTAHKNTAMNKADMLYLNIETQAI